LATVTTGIAIQSCPDG